MLTRHTHSNSTAFPLDSSRDVAAYKRLTNDVFVHGSVSLALAVAQETGMIKVLCQAEGPLTSAHIARRAKLKER